MSDPIWQAWRSTVIKVECRDTFLVSCPIRSLFGVRCLGCGMGHATLALLRGDIKTASDHNSLVFIVIPLLFWAVWDFARNLTARP